MYKDPQWHNLDRFFSRYKQLREDAEFTMQELINLAQYTSGEPVHPSKILVFEDAPLRVLAAKNAENLEKPGVDDEPQPVAIKYEDAYQVLICGQNWCCILKSESE
uniref:Uncharacterized protein n=1 Tax=Helianthus annuus TaxID=4232 RepID=A0A251V454_HELAN